ncbi:MAG: mechanosensitive ion channel domain-containing protein [Planctomycetota bacterium]
MLTADTTQNDSVPKDSALDQAMSSMLDGDFAAVNDYFAKAVLPNLGYAVIGLMVVVIGYFVSRYLSRVVSRPIRERVDETFGRFVGTAIFYVVMGGLIAAVASKLGAPLGGMTALLAAGGFAIGLAFQGSLSNFASGILMIVFRPFKVGDFVNIAGVSGSVNEIDLFTTTLDTPDNRRLIIPNSAISGATIENVSFHAHRRVEVIVGVDYDANMDETRASLQKALDTFAGETIPGEGRGSAVVLSELGDSAVVWKVRMWIRSSDYWPMKEALTGEVKRQLDSSGIGIPFPQLDVHVSRTDEAQSGVPVRPRMRPARRESHESSTDRFEGGDRFPFAS